MDYNKIEEKYIKANISDTYKFQNAIEVKNVLGYDFRSIKGFKILSDDDKKLAETLICGYINGHGLAAREKLKLISIEREVRRFKLNCKDGYSYLYNDGSIG